MKSTLAANRFKTHNNKSKELVASKFHSTLQNVRIVINTGLDKNTGKPIKGKAASFKAVFINNQSQWRTIAMGASFQPGSFKAHFGSKLTAIEVGAEDASTCKRCGAKNFKAKSGNVVCANACWTRWSGGNSKPRKSSNQKARTKAALARAASRTAVKRPDERKQIAEHYATFRTPARFRLLRVWSLRSGPSAVALTSCLQMFRFSGCTTELPRASPTTASRGSFHGWRLCRDRSEKERRMGATTAKGW